MFITFMELNLQSIKNSQYRFCSYPKEEHIVISQDAFSLAHSQDASESRGNNWSLKFQYGRIIGEQAGSYCYFARCDLFDSLARCERGQR